MTSFEHKFRDQLDNYRYDKEPSDDQVNDFFQKMEEESGAKTAFPFYMKLAASIILVLGAALISWTIASVEITTGLAEVKQVQLPDQSVVTLNAQSSLSYNRLAWILNRNVILEGEAFFEVTKGKNFAVVSTLGTTEVLGTSFNILARAETYDVKCHTGKVRVTAAEHKSILEPGDRVTVTNSLEFKESTFDTLKQTWKQGEYHYDNVTLEEVIKDLERAYGLSIDTSLIDGNKKYSGYFPSDNQSLALKLVFEPFGYTYREENNVVYVSIKIN